MNSEFITISSAEISVRLSSFGATLVSLTVADKDGKAVDVVLGFDSKEDYEKKDVAYMGRTVGRVCNRVRHGRFTFQEREYQLPINCAPHCLHGGLNGTAYAEWDVMDQSSSHVMFRYVTNEEKDGFPGDVVIITTYRVMNNQLIINHSATCNQPGILNLTNHTFFNLDGQDSVRDHVIKINADQYLPIDNTSIVTGEIRSVSNSEFDFRQPNHLNKLKDQSGIVSVDNDFVLNDCSGTGLSLYSAISGIRMDLSTNYPVVHLYAAMFLDNIGKKNVVYSTNKGLAIEPQFHTDAVNHANFPSIEISPDKPYNQTITYSFSCNPLV